MLYFLNYYLALSPTLHPQIKQHKFKTLKCLDIKFPDKNRVDFFYRRQVS